MDFNLCLIRFEKNITEEDPDGDVRMACLTDYVPSNESTCWIAGWGAEYAGESMSDSLQQASVTILERNYCLDSSGYLPSELGPDMICVGKLDNDGNGEADGGVNSCQGDWGGPLICDIEGKAALVGVASWGNGCALEGYPSIHSSAIYPSSYRWIRETVEPALITTTETMTTASNHQILTLNAIPMLVLLLFR